MEVYYSHTTISAPDKVQAYLDYLVKVAARAKKLGADNVYNDAEAQFNRIFSEWDAKTKAEVKKKRTWYDRLWGNTFDTFVYLPFHSSLEFEMSSVNSVYEFDSRLGGEEYASFKLLSSLQDMLVNPERHIENKGLFSINTNPFGNSWF